MEYWGSVGYESGRCFCRQGQEETEPVGLEPPTHESHCPMLVVPPRKLGFYDSHAPFDYFGGTRFAGSTIKTYAETSQPPTDRLTPADESGQAKVRPGVRRVSEILSRLNYLASKKGLEYHELIKCLEKDGQQERQEKAMEAMSKNPNFYTLDHPYGNPTPRNSINSKKQSQEDMFSPFNNKQTTYFSAPQGPYTSVFQLHPLAVPIASKTYTEPRAPGPYWQDSSKDQRPLTSAAGSRKVDMGPSTKLLGQDRSAPKDDENECCEYDSEEDPDSGSTYEFETSKQKSVLGRK